ncbi:hypothetical protein [Microvirga sp. P5_D2]
MPASLNLCGLAARLHGQPVHLLLVGPHELCHRLRDEQVLLQSLEDARLDVPTADCAIIGAGVLGTADGAAVAILGYDRVACTAAVAGQKPLQKEATTVSVVEGIAALIPAHREGGRLLASLDLVSELIVADAERPSLPALGRVGQHHPERC